MKNINYRAVLCIELLILYALSSCTNTRQEMSSCQKMEISDSDSKGKTRNKNWKKWMLLGVGSLAAVGTYGGMGYMNMSSSSNETSSNNIHFAPENIRRYNFPHDDLNLNLFPCSDEFTFEHAYSPISRYGPKTFKQLSIDKIRYLVKKGPLDKLKSYTKIAKNENMISGNRSTILVYALKNDAPTDIVEFLINKTVNLGISDRYDERRSRIAMTGKTALMYSIEKKYPKKITNSLIYKMNQKDLSEQDFHGNTALIYAIEKKYEKEILELLISKMDQESLAIENNCKIDALVYAIKRESGPEVINLLISKMALKDLGDNASYALSFAKYNNLTSIIQSLKLKGYNV